MHRIQIIMSAVGSFEEQNDATAKIYTKEFRMETSWNMLS